MTFEDRFAAAMAEHLGGARSPRLAVGLSGGGDSMALLSLACDWRGAEIHALIVDHGLRDASAEEAAFAAEEARRLGATPHILRWQGWDGRGNLQAEAREARRRLIWQKCTDLEIQATLLGHTQDDQAETFLMRLARGSGVEGLSAMAPGRFGRELFLRPLLDFSRAELRDYLRAKGLSWTEDPSNDNADFERVRIREELPALEQIGLTRSRLAQTARAQSRAAEALWIRARETGKSIANEEFGLPIFDMQALAKVERETQLRLLALAISCVAVLPYRPRLSALEASLEAALENRASTLQGCHLIPSRGSLIVARELKPVQSLETPADGQAVWAGRWQMRHDAYPVASIRALGPEGLAQVDRPAHLPHAALLAHPGVWKGQELLGAPGLGDDSALRWQIMPQASFGRALLSH